MIEALTTKLSATFRVKTREQKFYIDIFNSAGITRPPQNWEEFNSDVETITRLDGSGQITQSAAAIGTARNINRSTDLLSALMIQTGVKMTDTDNRSASFAR